MRTWAVCVFAVFALGACTSSDESGPANQSGASQSADSSSSAESNQIDLRFAYFGIADSGTIDQTLTITNPSKEDAVVPTLSFEALDASFEVLPDVVVTTAFGSDQGLVLAPANYEVFDILRFEGAGSGRVADVRVTVNAAQIVPDTGLIYPEVDYLDATGMSVDYPYEATAILIRNPGQNDTVVRVVGIRWDQPGAGRSQQARKVSIIGEPVRVPVQDEVVVKLKAQHVGRFDSLKAYLSVG